MKIALCSDLHLEFGDITLTNQYNADVLILSGDIMVAKDLPDPAHFESGSYTSDSVTGLSRQQESSEKYKNFLDVISKEFPHVIYVAGNHEHYHHEFSKTFDVIRKFVQPYGNIHFLEKEFVEIEGMRFIGGTLWTDMNNDDEETHYHVSYRMNDFRVISNGLAEYKRDVYKRDAEHNIVCDNGIPIVIGQETATRSTSFKTTDAYQEHKKMLRFIEQSLRPDGNNIVVGHHAPCKLSTKPKYQHDVKMNGGYSSDLIPFIVDHPIKLWTHGHTHDSFDYMIGTTRIVCNPRGYIGYEASADNFQLKYLEV